MSMRRKILGLTLILFLFVSSAWGFVARSPEQTMTLLNAASATGTGSIENLGMAYGQFTCSITYGGTVTASNVKLEGSIDRTSFFELGNTTSTSDDMFHVVNKPVSFVRGNVTVLTGTAPTVTMKCKAGGN